MGVGATDVRNINKWPQTFPTRYHMWGMSARFRKVPRGSGANEENGQQMHETLINGH